MNEILEGNELGVKFYTPLVQAMWDMTFSETPRMSVVHFEMAHYPFNMSLTGTIPYPDNIWDVRNYGVHYAYTDKVLQNLLQLILAQDPHAVIVLAADHGLHEVDFEQPIRTYFGEDALLPMWNNVLYAVRLPADMQDENAVTLLADPRNISRFLVNTYVGQNYNYITE